MDTYSQKKSSMTNYDLKSEKDRIIAITEQIKKELIEEWQRNNAGKAIFPNAITNVNPFAIEFLLSFKLIDVYNEISKLVNLNEKQGKQIPLLVWNAFLTVNLGGAENAIAEKFSLEESSKSLLAKLLKEKILNELSELNVKKFSIREKGNNIAPPASMQKSSDLAKMTLQDAIEKHKNIGDQLITSLPLKLRIFPDAVRPSLKNWITDYHDHVGSGKHGTIERGNYLFHSENGKKLSSLDRRKLAEVLKSLDDKDEVNVDTRLEQIVFSKNDSFQGKDISSKFSADQVKKEPEKIINDKANNFFMHDNTQKKSDIYAQNSSVSSINNKAKTKDEIDTFKKNDLNRNFGSFNVQGGRVDSMDKSNKEDEDGLRTSWNPAENVRKRMEGDDTAKKTETVGSIKFSSPQVLPAEKNERALGATSHIVPENPNEVKPQESHPDDNMHTDDLIERIREMNRNKDKNIQTKTSYKITPVGFSRPTNGSSFNKNGSGSGGRAVDLT